MQKILFILGQLNDGDVEWLTRQGTRRKYPAGSELIVEGEPNADLFIVLEGHVSVSLAERGEVDVLGSGEFLGEMSLVDSRPPSATVTALEDCYTLCIPHHTVRQQVEQDLGFGMRFYRALATFLSQRLRGERTLELGEVGLLADRELDGELDAYVLDNVQVAGERFARLLKTLRRAPVETPDEPGAGGP